MRDRYQFSREARVIFESWDYVTGHARHPKLSESHSDDGRWAALCVLAALAGVTPLELFEDADIYQHAGICHMTTCMSEVNGKAVQARYCAAHRYPRDRKLGDKLARPSAFPDTVFPMTDEKWGRGADVVNLRNYERNSEAAHFW